MGSPTNTIAFVGLGVMGYPMCVNLRSKVGENTTILICDTNAKAVEQFKAENSQHGPVEVVLSSAEAIKRANILISVMPTNEAMRTVFLDPQTGALAGAIEDPDQEKLLIECGTISQATIFEVADAARKAKNVRFVDAPISGGPHRSKEGTLSLMVGCDKDIFEHVHTLLSHMGNPKSIFHCGEVGAGAASKIMNNYISLISILSVSEAYNIATKMGLDLEVLTNVFNASSSQCWIISENNPVPGIDKSSVASRDYQGGFRIELAIKDLSLGRELADMVGARSTLNAAALEVYREAASDSRYTGKDARVMYKFLGEN